MKDDRRAADILQMFDSEGHQLFGNPLASVCRIGVHGLDVAMEHVFLLQDGRVWHHVELTAY